MEPLVILGSGLAGVTLARELRKLDADRPIVIVTRDSGEVYSKPMLSNALAGGRSPDSLASASPEALAAQLAVRVVTRREVRGIDTGARRVAFDDGSALGYSQLVLALGADPIRLPIGGDSADAVRSVNDLDDYRRWRAELASARRVTILGAGLIGCEFANDLVAGGWSVEIIDPAGWPLSRLVPEALGRAFEARLHAAGVDFRFGAAVESISRFRPSANAVTDSEDSLRAQGRYRLTLSTGESIASDLVLSAVGLAPRTELARAAGLAVGRGIVVDRQLRTSTPEVFALGDCAQIDGQVLPYVLPLMNAARTLAKVLAGQAASLSYPPMPVVVKTPAAPLSVAPPPPGAAGGWVIDGEASGALEARFMSPQARLLGYALLGVTPARRQELTRSLPPVLA